MDNKNTDLEDLNEILESEQQAPEKDTPKPTEVEKETETETGEDTGEEVKDGEELPKISKITSTPETTPDTPATPAPTTPPHFGIPINKANAWRKDAKEYKEKYEALQKEIENRNLSEPQKQAVVDANMEEWAKSKDLDPQVISELGEMIGKTILKPYQSILEQQKAQIEQSQQQKVYDDYFNESVATLKERISKEHGEDKVEAIIVKLKNKIIKDGLTATPIELVYNGDPMFRPNPSRRTVESSQGGRKQSVKSIANATTKDLEDGSVDAEEFFDNVPDL